MRQNTRILRAITALLLTFFLARPALAADNWGLSFGAPGTPPRGNADAAELAQYDAVYRVDTTEKVMYLTFDAGYENGNTSAILDILQKHEVPAAFFLVGNYLETQPDLVRRMSAEGHIVGNHTYHHPDMSKITDPEAFSKELQSLEALYKEVAGEEMTKLYRPPQGKYSPDNLKLAQQFGYKTFFWSLAYVDWLEKKQPSHEMAFEKLIPRAHPGAIILLHSTSRTNRDILDSLLTQWKADGYTFGRLDEIPL